MTPLEKARDNYERRLSLEQAIAVYLAAIAEDAETVEAVARAQMRSRFGVESIVMFEPPEEATTEQRLILSERVHQARKEAKAALLTLSTISGGDKE